MVFVSFAAPFVELVRGGLKLGGFFVIYPGNCSEHLKYTCGLRAHNRTYKYIYLYINKLCIYIYIYIIIIIIIIIIIFIIMCIIFNTLNPTHPPHNHQNLRNHAYKVHKVLFADKVLCVSQARKL